MVDGEAVRIGRPVQVEDYIKAEYPSEMSPIYGIRVKKTWRHKGDRIEYIDLGAE